MSSSLSPFKIVLISTYELGRQPFGLASPAAWLSQEGFEVHCLDLAVESLDLDLLNGAHLVACYVPMHTATRLALKLLPQIQKQVPEAHLCFYGLYAPLNEAHLRAQDVQTLLGGEFESGLVQLSQSLRQKEQGPDFPLVSLIRQKFQVPQRKGLPRLDQYAQLHQTGQQPRLVGTVEASRGCKHRCAHCPIVPVYQGRFFVIQQDIVLEDIRQQVAAGATHITFADPDFFNGVGHALPLTEALHQEFPTLTYDVTIKVEHLLKHAQHLETLQKNGCVMVTSAIESTDDRVLERFQKGHTQEDFIQVVQSFQKFEMVLQPTFIPFHPWTSMKGYRDFLHTIAHLGLVEHVPSIQLAIRLLITEGSPLLALPEIQALIGPFAEEALAYPWIHPDPQVDALHTKIMELVSGKDNGPQARKDCFLKVWDCAFQSIEGENQTPPVSPSPFRATIPYLNEPWYC